MLSLKNIVKIYGSEDNKVAALKGVSLDFRKSEFVSILGHSGCGKTTMLNIIGGLDRYTSGDLLINGRSTKKFADSDWDTYRNHSIGFVFQSYNLIPHLTVLGNVEIALTISGIGREERRERAVETLKRVGLEDQINKLPNQLSGGQMQRVAIARALVNNPEIILADEPTGALDSENSVQIMELLKEVAGERLVILVTHNGELADKYSTRIVRLSDGEIVGDTNPYTEEEKKEEEKKDKKAGKKSAMNFFTALNLSFRNLLTKKGRTIITSLAGSIGIIGVSLVLAISNGFNIYINNMQTGTLGGYPISIGMYAADLDALRDIRSPQEELPYFPVGDDNLHINNPQDVIGGSGVAHLNIIDQKFYDYIEELNRQDKAKNEDNRLMSALTYSYSATKHVLTKFGDDWYYYIQDESATTDSLSIASILLGSSSSVFQEEIDNKSFISSQYDLIYGKEATEVDELMLVVDSRNRLNKSVVSALGLPTSDAEGDIKTISFQDIVDKARFRMVYNDAYYTRTPYYTMMGVQSEYFKPMTADDSVSWSSYYNDLSEGDYKELKIVGVYRLKENAPLDLYNEGIVYKKELTADYINNSMTSEIVSVQKAEFEKPENQRFFFGDYAALLASFTSSGYGDSSVTIDTMVAALGGYGNYKIPWILVRGIYTTFFGTTMDENILTDFLKQFGIATLGGNSLPSSVTIYPKGFDQKNEILKYIDKYNEEADDNHKIIYTDASSMLTSSLGQIINIVQIVLIAFSAVSLVVSSIMIGIITYVSVIERTKEIGVLRAVGARKKDISRVFNAETLIIGFFAGILGIAITYLLCLALVNPIINAVAEGAVTNIANFNPLHAIVMVAISMVLTLIGGSIPAGIASKKDPVVALRTE